ncbi:MAG: hypothetical protein BMS9Abin09_0423 [Gammaproteobacteria bacterium]|nr:MAG: hypothetical protein BMS9Abin09_0423 [Gammaproteobacteria bacterium]
MACQLSPAWQRKAVSSDRLAKISARFLSDTPKTGQGADTCRAIPFLLDNPELVWVAHDLCGILAERGHGSMLYHLREPSEDGQYHHLVETLHSQAGSCEFCLLPTTSAETVLAHAFDHVVLLVPANLDAVLRAYHRIKVLAQQNTPEIGVVLVGPRDQHAAWRFFRKLAVGTLRYLDVPLLNLGFLPEQVTPEHAAHDHHRNNFLTRISERLLRSKFYSTLPDRKAVRENV